MCVTEIARRALYAVIKENAIILIQLQTIKIVLVISANHNEVVFTCTVT